MERLISIRKNSIIYDPETLEQGISNILAKRFPENSSIETSLDDLHDPYLFSGMKEAVERIKKAKAENERVIIF